MSEIVERLRFTARVRQTSRPDDDPITVECLEAAAEIAKLRAEVAWHEKVQTSQAATIERLTAALKKVRDTSAQPHIREIATTALTGATEKSND